MICQPSAISWGDASLTWIAMHLRHEWLNPIMIFLSNLGKENIIILLIACCYWLWNKRYAKYLGYGLFCNILLNITLKSWFHECRPPQTLWMELIPSDSFSFPSGHAQIGSILWLGIAYYVPNRILSTLFVFIGLMIGFARSYMGVHYLHDILVGWILGLIVLGICILFEKKSWQPLKHVSLWGQAFILLSFLLLFNFSIESNTTQKIAATAAFFGFWLGCAWEAKFLRFNSAIKPLTLLGQLFIGLMGIGFILLAKKLISGLISVDLKLTITIVLYFALGIWITVGAPFVFAKYKLVTKSN